MLCYTRAPPLRENRYASASETDCASWDNHRADSSPLGTRFCGNGTMVDDGCDRPSRFRRSSLPDGRRVTFHNAFAASSRGVRVYCAGRIVTLRIRPLQTGQAGSLISSRRRCREVAQRVVSSGGSPHGRESSGSRSTHRSAPTQSRITALPRHGTGSTNAGREPPRCDQNVGCSATIIGPVPLTPVVNLRDAADHGHSPRCGAVRIVSVGRRALFRTIGRRGRVGVGFFVVEGL